MKIERLLSLLAAFGVIVALSSLAADALALSLFSFSSGIFVVLTAMSDYTRSPHYATALAVAPHPRERMPLAA